MAHLVPIPQPAEHWVPKLTHTSVGLTGILHIGVWGVIGGKEHCRVGTTNDDGNDDVNSELAIVPGTTSDIAVYKISGVRMGHKLAVFVPAGAGLQRFSEFVEIDSNLADKWSMDFLTGKLPKCSHNQKIAYYPFGSSQKKSNPVSEEDWLRSMERQFDAICANPLGSELVKMIDRDIVIYPWIKSYRNANSAVKYSPQDWHSGALWGASPDEILLHELIHVLENNYGDYEDRYGFSYDGSDFLSVNATNVYSCLLGRSLRKDHHGFSSLPSEHFRNPKLHYEQQEPNYKKAKAQVPKVIAALRKYPNVWNPFVHLSAWW